MPLQVIITAAKTVSLARVELLSPPSTIRVTIRATSMIVTATARTREPNGSPTRWATTSAWCTAASTAPARTRVTSTTTAPGRSRPQVNTSRTTASTGTADVHSCVSVRSRAIMQRSSQRPTGSRTHAWRYLMLAGLQDVAVGVDALADAQSAQLLRDFARLGVVTVAHGLVVRVELDQRQIVVGLVPVLQEHAVGRAARPARVALPRFLQQLLHLFHALGLEADDLHELHGRLQPATAPPGRGTRSEPNKHRERYPAIRRAPLPVMVLPTSAVVRPRCCPSERLRPPPAPPRPPPASSRPAGW